MIVFWEVGIYYLKQLDDFLLNLFKEIAVKSRVRHLFSFYILFWNIPWFFVIQGSVKYESDNAERIYR